MTPTAAIVVFAVIWFLTLFVMLPIGLRTQGEDGRRGAGHAFLGARQARGCGASSCWSR